MKPKSTNPSTLVYAVLVVFLLAFTVVQAEGRSLLAPDGNPLGSILTSDGTPYEEPELSPQAPRKPKDPRTHRAESAIIEHRASSVSTERSGRERVFAILFQFLYRVRF